MNDPYYTNAYDEDEEEGEDENEEEIEVEDEGVPAGVPNKLKFEELLNKYDEMITTKAVALFPELQPQEEEISGDEEELEEGIIYYMLRYTKNYYCSLL